MILAASGCSFSACAGDDQPEAHRQASHEGRACLHPQMHPLVIELLILTKGFVLSLGLALSRHHS